MPHGSRGYRGGGGGGGGDTDATFDDTLDASDVLVISDLSQPDTLDTAEVLRDIDLDVTDTVLAAEGIDDATVTSTNDDSVDASEVFTGDVTVEPTGDTYLDRDNGTTSFGSSTTLLAKQNTAVVNDDKNAYIWWDLLTWAGVAATSGATATCRISHDAVTNQTLTYEWYSHTSASVTESDTWDANEQPAGTLIVSNTVSVANGAAADYDLTMTQAQLDGAFGDFLYVRIRGNQGIGGDLTTFTVVSSEGANAPSLQFTIAGA